ncbi:MAG: IS1634 family transposase, partial [Candidatus Dormibacteraceae bacterium]
MSRRGGAVHISSTHRQYKGHTYESHLLRRSYREDGKVKSQTLANLSHLPADSLAVLRRSLAGEKLFGSSQLLLESARPYGHVAAVLAQCRQLGFPALLDRTPSRQRDLVLGMIAQRVIEPASKLATTRLWRNSALAQDLHLGEVTEDELYGALDWLFKHQPAIERRLAKHHLQEGGMVLYDLTSSYFEGTHCPLAKIGYSRDRKTGKAQLEYGVIADAQGRPVAIEAFAGNTGDPSTVPTAVDRLKNRFQLNRVVLV